MIIHRWCLAVLVIGGLACGRSAGDAAPDVAAAQLTDSGAAVSDSGIVADAGVVADSSALDGAVDAATADASSRSESGSESIPWDAGFADFFPIGVWYVRGQQDASITHDMEMKDLHDEGFNTVVLSLQPTIPDVILPAAEANRIRVIPYMQAAMSLLRSTGQGTITEQQAEDALSSDAVDRFKASPATLGYYVDDEPNPYVMNAANLGTFKTALGNVDPGRVSLSAWNIRENMPALNAGASTDVLFMDEYPLATDKAVGDLSDAWPRGDPATGSFYGGKDLPTFSDYQDMCMSVVPNVPTWIIVQAFEGTYWRRPTPKELRLEIFTSVMHGARGLIYFIYQTEWPNYRGLRDENYAPTDLLTEAIDINAKLNALAPTLLKLHRDDATAVTANAGQYNAFGMPTAEVKAFKHKTDPAVYLAAVNNDVTAAQDVAITVDASNLGALSALEIRDVVTGEVIAYQVSANQISLRLNVAAGDGRVLRVK